MFEPGQKYATDFKKYLDQPKLIHTDNLTWLIVVEIFSNKNWLYLFKFFPNST